MSHYPAINCPEGQVECPVGFLLHEMSHYPAINCPEGQVECPVGFLLHEMSHYPAINCPEGQVECHVGFLLHEMSHYPAINCPEGQVKYIAHFMIQKVINPSNKTIPMVRWNVVVSYYSHATKLSQWPGEIYFRFHNLGKVACPLSKTVLIKGQL